jgi:hypothetical protein
MAIGQKQVWAKVLDFTVQDYATKAVLFQVKYAQDCAISENYEKTEIKGGSDNQIQYTSYHSPTAKFTAKLPLIDDNVIAVKTGSLTTTGAQTNAFEKTFTVDASAGTVTIGVVPLTGTLKIYNVDVDDNLGTEITVAASAPTAEQYSIAGGVCTFNTAKKGARVLIVCDYTTGVNATGVKFVSGKLPSLIRITAKTKVEDKAGNKAVKTIIIERAKPDPNFEFSTTAGTPASLPFDCEVFGWTNPSGDSQFFNLVTDPTLEV